MRSVVPFLLCLIVAPLLYSCGSSPPAPADVQGTYMLSASNGPSTCPLQNWNQGATTTGIPFTVSQNGASLSVDVGGPGAVLLERYSGNPHFDGTASGSDIHLTLTGTRSLTSGACVFTVDASVVGTVQNDVLTGILSYAPSTNKSPDCVAVHDCYAWMSLDGALTQPGD